jgi:hypothetical protein
MFVAPDVVSRELSLLGVLKRHVTMAINHAVQCGELKLLRKASTKILFGICFKVNYIYKQAIG